MAFIIAYFMLNSSGKALFYYFDFSDYQVKLSGIDGLCPLFVSSLT